MKRLLEVIACTVADAVEAQAGGAGRLELVRDLDLGGMTPPFSLVEEVLAAVTIPVRVMVRETESHVIARALDIDRLREAARKCSHLPLDGIVMGFLKNGRVDVELMRSLLEAAGTLPATFHRAFEGAEDPFEAIATLKELDRVDRILTKVTPAIYQPAAAPEITILAGGGITRDTPALKEFHVGSAARGPEGAVRRDLVRNLVNELED